MSIKVALCGGDALAAAARALDLEQVEDGAALVILELGDPAAIARAARHPASLPRIVVAGDADAMLVRALGVATTSVASTAEPELLGPLVRAALPQRAVHATRLVVCTATRGGVGRTLMVANLATRLAARMSVAAVDITGSGTLGWWLRSTPRPWSELEGLVGELSSDHVAMVAAECPRGLRVVGGPPVAPSVALARAAVRAALALADLVIVDAPPLADERTRALAAEADRVIALAYADPASLASLDGAEGVTGAWLVASQSATARLGERDAFRALPRDDSAVAAALTSRDAIGGALGRAYDELTELLAADTLP